MPEGIPSIREIIAKTINEKAPSSLLSSLLFSKQIRA
jgi:hypothetical protein